MASESTLVLKEFVLPSVGLVYDLPNSVYQQSPAVSRTQLEVFRVSPHHFHARCAQEVPAIFEGDEDDEDDSSKRKTLFAGTLCHCATLEPEAFDLRYAVGPQVKTRAAKEWKDAVKARPDRVLVTPREYAVAHGQAAALRRVDAVAEILEGGRCEVSGFWIDPPTGLPCRCRPDCANRDFGTAREPLAMLLDVKSARDASRRGVQQAIARNGYHHQAEWYSRGYASASGVRVAGFVFAFVEHKYPFAVSVYELDFEAWDIAARENREALDRLAQCRREGYWPGYPAEVESVGLPRWAGGSE